MLTSYERKEDAELIAGALKGSEKAWICLVKRYEKKVFNHALRISSNREDAMDIMQDTFLAVYRNLQSYRGEGSFRAWLFRIAVFRATDLLRRKKMKLEELVEIEDIDSNGDPEAQSLQQSDNVKIMQLMQPLSFDARQILELKFFQSFTFEEIAGQLGISVNTAKSRLYAALEKMRQSESRSQMISNT